MKRVFFAGFILCLLSGCASGTRTIIADTPYETVWRACMDVSEDLEGPGNTRVKMFGVEVYKDGVDRQKGAISFSTGELLLIHAENKIRVKQLKEEEVEVTVSSGTRAIFLPGTSRNKEIEEEILEKIEKRLYGESNIPL